MEVLIIIIIVIAVLISIIKEHSEIIIAVLLLGGYLYIANKLGIGVVKAILGAVVFAVLLGIVVNIFFALLNVYRKSKKSKILNKIRRYFRHCKPTDDYNLIKQKAFKKYGGIDFKLGGSCDKSDFYIVQELDAFVERVRAPIINDIVSEYNKQALVKDEFITHMCQKYSGYCIGDISIRSFVISILTENGSRTVLEGETAFVVKNSRGGTNLNYKGEFSEDELDEL
ncbi:MAG: hypothetical protein HDT21_05880 [Ruminococcus sp.]|nr:hypothetical protein [Ruminococcus sp.]